MVAARVRYDESVTGGRVEFFDDGFRRFVKVEFHERTYRNSALVEYAAGLIEVNVFGVLRNNGSVHSRKLAV